MRIELTKVVSTPKGKWFFQLTAWGGIPGNEHVLANAWSATMYPDEVSAYAAAHREMDAYEESGVFPNLYKW